MSIKLLLFAWTAHSYCCVALVEAKMHIIDVRFA